MRKEVECAKLFEKIPSNLKSLFEESKYPWEILPKIKTFIQKALEEGLPGYIQLFPGVLVGDNVKFHPNAVIEAPAIIGANTEIRPGAYLRGNVICGEGCVIGNSTELKNCLLMDRVQVPHYNYVGDSILGYHAHMGAGSICSNLKSDGKNIVIHGETEIETGLRKIGGILGDGADIGCGSVINPGTVVGKGTSVYPLTSLRGVYPANCIVKDQRTCVPRKS